MLKVRQVSAEAVDPGGDDAEEVIAVDVDLRSKFAYRTWSHAGSTKKEEQEELKKAVSMESLDQINKKINHLNICDQPLEAVSLSEALETLSLSYSPRSKRLMLGRQSNKAGGDSPATPSRSDKEVISKKSSLESMEQSINHTSWSPPQKLINQTLSPDKVIADDGEVHGEPKTGEVEPKEEQEQLDVDNPVVEADAVRGDDGPPVRYVHGHRKAFSLPRTLEVVNDDGSISHYPQPQIESPRSTLQRFGVVQIPVQAAHEDDWSSISSISSRTGVSQMEQNSETSSQCDSGIQSQSTSNSSSKQQQKKGFTDIISKGITANWKLFSKSSQQVVKLMRRPESRDLSSLESTSSVVSSQSLIMEDRPPGLPAKLSQEKEKHSQEFQAILQSMKKREKEEKSEKARKQADQRRVEDDLSASVNVWTTQVIPNWSAARQSRKTQQLWWKGLPPPVRGKVWKLALENQLNLTPQLYSILVNRAESQISRWRKGHEQRKPETEGAPQSPCREETLELISLDVSRTFPQLCIFQKGGPYYSQLHNVLGAYVCYRPDLGYVQGMSFLAAILILNMEEDDAFILFANLVNRPPLAAFFNMDQQMMEGYYSNFTSLLLTHLPEVHRHMEDLGLRPDMYLLDWIMTLYGRAAPLDIACRIWDLMFRDGQDFIFKAALGILDFYKERILAEQDFTEVAQFLSRLPENLSPDTLFSHIEDLNLQPRQKSFHSMFSR